MSDPNVNAEPSNAANADRPGEYVVVARRYRPQTFEELIGQQHVAKALSGAITTNRVGHAYLFTGARGVGKTSAARILAKALNCQSGPAPVPCNGCDICQSVSSGEDVDVLEIDGASNRGIDEIRQLRQNVNVRPSRSRFKIYIIDEVHMLTREAFNALLKTLEEPPEHVKFIFCTTEAAKIPITILSRCQRFDFAGILTGAIVERLQQIVLAEGVEADLEALEVLARRAAGSMRDSQSLLEQLLAFAPGHITLDDVHSMLGTAGDERLLAMVEHMVNRDAAAVLADLAAAVDAGIDLAQLLEQLFAMFRDCMVAAVDCPAESFLSASPASREQVARAGKQLGLTTILAAMQIADQALARMKFSTQGRILAELALVRICHLEDLDELPATIARLRSGTPPMDQPVRPPASSAAPANRAPSTSSAPVGESATPPRVEQAPPAEGKVIALSQQNAAEIWSLALGRMSGMVVEQAKQFDHVEAPEANRLAVTFKPGYALAKSSCERPEQVARFEQALAQVTGQPIRVRFAVAEDAPTVTAVEAEPTTASPHQRLMEASKHPMIQRASELFGAQPTRVDPPSPP